MKVNLQNIIKYIILSYSLLFITEQARAQFTITDNFRESTSPGIIIGDQAKLTSGDEDPLHAGWLRLTNDGNSQKGYAYVNKSFPSTLGISIDFEYTMWRTTDDTQYGGADGFSLYLFDAAYGPADDPLSSQTFALGGYGGSLGYANNDHPSIKQAGLTGGYLGIGFDAFGGFGRPTEGKNGGATGNRRPNSIVFRGKTVGTTSDNKQTNAFLKGITILGNGDIRNILDPVFGNVNDDVIDYNTSTATRPTKEQFYRRVLVEIIPTPQNTYEINIEWATEFGGEFTELMTYESNEAPPELLKIGFAASTGGGFNNHEVRNLMITTPGDLSVTKRAKEDILRSIPRPSSESEGPSNEMEYRIDVYNDIKTDIDNIDFTDQLMDANGNPIPDGLFKIYSISSTGFLGNTSLPNPSEQNPITSGSFEGTLHIAAESTATIIVKGRLEGMPEGNVLANLTSALPTTIVDKNLANNSSVVYTPVVSEKADLIITGQLDQSCLIAQEGNNFEFTVSNIGTLPLTYGGSGEANSLSVETELPANVSISAVTGAGWSHSESGSTHTFTRTAGGTVNSGQSLPPIYYTLTSSTPNVSYTNIVTVSSDAEPQENRNNNEEKNSVNPTPDAPIAEETIYYCLGETAVPLEAEATSGNTLQWYLNQGGTSSNIAFTPDTSVPGSRKYYVSQQAEGGCESAWTEITVIVLEETLEGSISGDQEICVSTLPAAITSNQIGSGNNNSNISYRWESSVDGGQTWTSIENANGEAFQPSILQQTTSFRRITVATLGADEAECESEPTNIVTVTTKKCKVITNPMIRQRTK